MCLKLFSITFFYESISYLEHTQDQGITQRVHYSIQKGYFICS